MSVAEKVGMLGYDATQQNETFENIERAKALLANIKAKRDEARARGATEIRRFEAETEEFYFDPNGIDPENNQMGYMGTRGKSIVTPPLEYSSWRVKAESEDSNDDSGTPAYYEWTIENNPDEPDANPVLVLESPYTAINDFNRPMMSGAGVAFEGRRIQEYVVGDDGKVYGRSADYTTSTNSRRFRSGTPYRLIPASAKQWVATEDEVAFIESSMQVAELNAEKSK